MLTVIFGLFTGVCVYFILARTANMSSAVSVSFAVIAMFLFQLGVMLWLRRASGKINKRLQEIMTETSNTLRSMQNQFMRRPVGSQKTMMQSLEREQNAGLDRMLAALDLYKPLYLWNLLMRKQVNAMRAIFLFQQKKFQQVDELLPKCVFFDVQSVCVKMVRMYKLGQDGIDKFYRKKGARFRGEDIVLPASLYAWILVQQNRIEDAVKVLNQAKTKSSNEVIARNWEMLVNGKVKHFSNSQLGELWYSLYLEEPKMQRVQQQAVRYR